MAKATYTLPNGTVVQIDGTTEEIKELSAFYGAMVAASGASPTAARPKAKSVKLGAQQAQEQSASGLDIMAIVNQIKSCDEADEISDKILDGRDFIAKALLPMYIGYKYFGNTHAFSTGQISKVAAQLGTKLDQANVSRYLSASAKAYVIADKVRKKGSSTGYKLSRRGAGYIETILTRQA